MIPEEVDWIAVFDELNGFGMNDSGIEILCKLKRGYVSQMRCGNLMIPGYEKGARLMNLLDKNMGLDTSA